MVRTILSLLLLLVLFTPAHARTSVVATLPWIGSLAREIGRDRIDVTVLVKPNQDPHGVEAKPSMILAARKADILMYNGLDLEVGYLPLIVQSSRNPAIQSGRPGNLDCSRFVTVLDRMATADRSLGDVHPLGNPHYHYSPVNILRVADGMARALAALDGANAGFYRANYAAFVEKLGKKRQTWQEAGLAGRHYVAYHKLFEYLASDFGLQIVGYIEQKPGIPPSSAHLGRLVETMKRVKVAGILATGAAGRRDALSLGELTGTRVVILPQDVGAEKGADDWFSFMDRVINALR